MFLELYAFLYLLGRTKFFSEMEAGNSVGENGEESIFDTSPYSKKDPKIAENG